MTTNPPPTMDPGANTPAAVRAAVAVAGPGGTGTAAARGETIAPPPPPERPRREQELQERYAQIQREYERSKYLSRSEKSQIRASEAPDTPVSDAQEITLRSRGRQPDREMLDQGVVQAEERDWDAWYTAEQIRAAILPHQLRATVQQRAQADYEAKQNQLYAEQRARDAEAQKYGYNTHEELMAAIQQEKATKRLNELGSEMFDLGQMAREDYGEYYRETGRDLGADMRERAAQIDQLEAHISQTFGTEKSPDIARYTNEIREYSQDIRTRWAAAEGLNNTLNRLANEYWSNPPVPGSALPDPADAPLLPAGLGDRARAAGYTGSSLKEFESWRYQYTSDVIDAKTAPAKFETKFETEPSTVLHPTESMSTYGFYEVMRGRADWWNENVVAPFEKHIASRVPLGGISTGIVRSPAIAAELVGMAPPGLERISKTPGNIPEYIQGGLELQGQSIYKGLTQRPAEFAGELIGLGLLTRGVRGGLGKVPGYARTVGKEYISIEKIGYDVEHGYPLGKTTPAGLQTSFAEGTLLPRPDMMAGSWVKEVPYVPKSARLPTDPSGAHQMWTGWEHRIKPDVPFGREVTLGSGASEIPGMYGAPVALSYFTKAGGIPKLFGFDLPSLRTPSILRTQVSEFEAIPRPLSRETIGLKTQGASNEVAYSSINKFLAANKEPGKAYLPMTKAEYEAVLPEGNVLELLGSRYYTKVGGVGRSHVGGTRVPIYELRVTGEMDPILSTGRLSTTPKKSKIPPLDDDGFRQRPIISGTNLAASVMITTANRQYSRGTYTEGAGSDSTRARSRNPGIASISPGVSSVKPSYEVASSYKRLFVASTLKPYALPSSRALPGSRTLPVSRILPNSRTLPVSRILPNPPPPIPPSPPPRTRLGSQDPRRRRKPSSRRAWTGMDVSAAILSGFEALTGRPDPRLKVSNRLYPLAIEINGKITQKRRKSKKHSR
jgi:hypothetical protein